MNGSTVIFYRSMNERLKSPASTKQVYIWPLKKYSLVEIDFDQLPFYAILSNIIKAVEPVNLIFSLCWFSACYRCWLSLAINLRAGKFPKGSSCSKDKNGLFMEWQ